MGANAFWYDEASALDETPVLDASLGNNRKCHASYLARFHLAKTTKIHRLSRSHGTFHIDQYLVGCVVIRCINWFVLPAALVALYHVVDAVKLVQLLR